MLPRPPISTLFPYTTLFRSLSGEVPRGEAPRITGKPERTARRILEQLLDNGLVISSTPKGPIRLAFPAKVIGDRKSTRLNSSHRCISYAVFCLKKKKKIQQY